MVADFARKEEEPGSSSREPIDERSCCRATLSIPPWIVPSFCLGMMDSDWMSRSVNTPRSALIDWIKYQSSCAGYSSPRGLIGYHRIRTEGRELNGLTVELNQTLVSRQTIPTICGTITHGKLKSNHTRAGSPSGQRSKSLGKCILKTRPKQNRD